VASKATARRYCEHCILAAAITAIAAAQSDSVAATSSWTAEFKGQIFIRLELRTIDGRLRGSISTGDLQVDEKGDIRHVEHPRSDPTAIFDVVQQGATVTFSRKDEHDTDRFEFRVLNSARGESRLIPTKDLLEELAAAGIPMPKPIILSRKTEAKH
jgi:hypothetical protein